MSPVAVFALSLSMSVDAFAVAVGRGATTSRTRLTQALQTGLVFGVVEAITPFVGWLFGIAANNWVAAYDHWLAFIMLAGVGLHMIYGAFKHEEAEAEEALVKPSLLLLMATALGTSLDAMAVGLSLALIDVDLGGILAVSAGVGFTTFVLATIGMLIGKAIGDRFGKIAEVLAGLVLCGIGATILFEHMFG